MIGKCAHREKLQDYLDEYGPNAPLGKVWENHIYGAKPGDKGCPSCRKFYLAYREFMGLFDRVEGKASSFS
ncbi:MAG: hypothetical protein PQJ59_09985 [Spirochaetales bacterium]|nr:hypothetical protein [Spirochaetales bacterium]